MDIKYLITHDPIEHNSPDVSHQPLEVHSSSASQQNPPRKCQADNSASVSLVGQPNNERKPIEKEIHRKRPHSPDALFESKRVKITLHDEEKEDDVKGNLKSSVIRLTEATETVTMAQCVSVTVPASVANNDTSNSTTKNEDDSVHKTLPANEGNVHDDALDCIVVCFPTEVLHPSTGNPRDTLHAYQGERPKARKRKSRYRRKRVN